MQKFPLTKLTSENEFNAEDADADDLEQNSRTPRRCGKLKDSRWLLVLIGLFFVVFVVAVIMFWTNRTDSPENDLVLDLSHPPSKMLTIPSDAVVRMHTKYLSDDLFEGRAPGTRGEQLAAQYMATQFAMAGLQPAGPNGSYFQSVPFRGLKPIEMSDMVLKRSGEIINLSFVSQYVGTSDLFQQTVSVQEAPLLFVGYGIVAPSFNWDDYKGADVRGKILVSLVNDPPATPQEPTLFDGFGLTYYGRWTYKLEEARRKGALGVLLVHTDASAGYPWAVVRNGGQGESVSLKDTPSDVTPLHFRGWMTQTSAETLANVCGQNLTEWMRIAANRNFRPLDLNTTLSVSMEFKLREFTGTNVWGVLRSSGQIQKNPTSFENDEVVMYTAHHDHLGIGPADTRNDTIYNGALDNASGLTALLSVVSSFSSVSTPASESFGATRELQDTLRVSPLRRSVLFGSLTGEESILLGSLYYIQNPTVALEKSVVNINFDGMNVFGATQDTVAIGAEKSNGLEMLYAAAAKEEGMIVSPDPSPNQGHFFRGDQLSFAKAGIPGVNQMTGTKFIGQPENYHTLVAETYNRLHYHQPSDEYDPNWNFEGALQQIRIAIRLGYGLANMDVRLRWNAGESIDT